MYIYKNKTITMSEAKDFINWRELARHLAGNSQSIRSNKVPKKYEEKVKELLQYVEQWKNKD